MLVEYQYNTKIPIVISVQPYQKYSEHELDHELVATSLKLEGCMLEEKRDADDVADNNGQYDAVSKKELKKTHLSSKTDKLWLQERI